MIEHALKIRRATGRVGIPSLVLLSCCPMVLLFDCIGTPGPRKLPTAEVAKSPWRPFGAPRLDFFDFSDHKFRIDFWIDF